MSLTLRKAIRKRSVSLFCTLWCFIVALLPLYGRKKEIIISINPLHKSNVIVYIIFRRVKSMSEMMIFWLVVLIVAVVIEAATLGLATIWFAGGALIAILATMLHAPIWLQILVFLVVSILLLVFTRPIAVKYFNINRVRTNAEGLVGKQAIVLTDIDNLQAVGTVTVNGQEWSARSFDDKVRIKAGAVVDVQAINGVRLIVKANAQMKDFLEEAKAEPQSVLQDEV